MRTCIISYIAGFGGYKGNDFQGTAPDSSRCLLCFDRMVEQRVKDSVLIFVQSAGMLLEKSWILNMDKGLHLHLVDDGIRIMLSHCPM